jgi:hypothetical protein
MRRHLFLLILSFITFLLQSLPSFGAECTIKNDYFPSAQCSNVDVIVNNDNELDAYLANFGYDGNKYHGVFINYNVNRPVIEIHSPCTITLNDMVLLTGDSVCVDAAEGINNDNGITVNAAGAAGFLSEAGSVFLGKGTALSAGNLTVTAGETVKISEDSIINVDGAVDVTSTGSSKASKALIKSNVSINAASLFIEAPRGAHIEEGAVVNVTDDASLISTGSFNDSQAILKKNASLRAATFTMTSGNKAILSMNTSVRTSGNFHMQAQSPAQCTIDNTTGIVAGSVSGNCLNGFITVPKVTGLLFPDAQNAITSAGLTVGAVRGAYRLTLQTDRVIDQDPLAGSLTTAGTVVNLSIVLPPPAGATLPVSWEGLWEITVTYRDPEDNSIIGREIMTNVICEGDSLGIALAESIASTIPAINSFTCSESVSANHIEAMCDMNINFLGVCPLDAHMEFQSDLMMDSISGSGLFLGQSNCGFEGHQNLEISGTRLGPDNNGLCDRPASTIMQKFLRHPEKAIGGRF